MPYDRNDYIILMDENGTPYIAHGWVSDTYNKAKNAATAAGNKIKEWKDHMYVARAKDSNGNWLYFYTQKAYQAFLRNTGIGGKKRIEKERQELGKAFLRNTGIGGKKRIEKERQELGKAQDTATRAKIRDEQLQARYKNNNDQSVAARQQRADASRNSAVANRELRKEQADVDRAIDEYDRSWLGRAENATKNVISKTKSQFERMKGEFADKKQDTMDKGRQAIDNITSKGRQVVDKATGKVDIDRLQKELENAKTVEKRTRNIHQENIRNRDDRAASKSSVALHNATKDRQSLEKQLSAAQDRYENSIPQLTKNEMKEIANKLRNGVNVSKDQLKAYYDQLYSMFNE